MYLTAVKLDCIQLLGNVGSDARRWNILDASRRENVDSLVKYLEKGVLDLLDVLRC